MTCSLVSIFIGSNNSDIFKIANWDGRFIWDKCNGDFTRFIRSIDSTSGFIEVDNITVLSVYQLYHITLWAAQ